MIALGWLALLAVSVWAALAGFLWALHAGQFSDQGRARYLPLADDGTASALPAGRRRRPWETFALLGVSALALAAIAALLVMLAVKGPGGAP